MEAFPQPYRQIPLRRPRRSSAVGSALTRPAHAPRTSPPASLPSPSPSSALVLRQAYRPSRSGDARCSRRCCDRGGESLFAEDDAAEGSLSAPPAATRTSLNPSAAAHWTVLLASITASSALDGSLLSESASSSASSLPLVTPPDEQPTFAFAGKPQQQQQQQQQQQWALNLPRFSRTTDDALVQELEGGFEWALEKALVSLKTTLSSSRRARRGRSSTREQVEAADAAVGGAARVVGMGGISQRRSRSSTRTAVSHGACPLTRPRSPSPVRAALAPVAVPRALPQPAQSAKPRPLFSIRLPSISRRSTRHLALSVTPVPAFKTSARWTTTRTDEAYLSSLPLLSMTRPPSPAQVLRPHFPVLRPRALERWVVFGHMRRAGKIGQAGGGDVEWRRVRERRRRGSEGSALRYEI